MKHVKSMSSQCIPCTFRMCLLCVCTRVLNRLHTLSILSGKPSYCLHTQANYKFDNTETSMLVSFIIELFLACQRNMYTTIYGSRAHIWGKFHHDNAGGRERGRGSNYLGGWHSVYVRWVSDITTLAHGHACMLCIWVRKCVAVVLQQANDIKMPIFAGNRQWCTADVVLQVHGCSPCT